MANEPHYFSEFDSFQRDVGDWGEATFPNSTMKSCIAHLKREIKEFEESEMTFGSIGMSVYSGEELADCFLLILHLAHKCGISLDTEARRKFVKIQLRTWGEPDAEGVVEHVGEDEP